MSVTLSHSGLPDGLTPFGLLDVLEKLRVRLGLRDEDLAYLRFAFRLVRNDDFRPGRICAFWERVAGLADRLGYNVRRISRIESRLEAAGLILRTSSANGRRYGARDQSGCIRTAAGINLQPMIARANEIIALLRVSSDEAQRLKLDRCRANDLVRQIRSLDATEALEAAREIFPRLRPSEIQDHERLSAIIAALEAIIEDFSNDCGRTVEPAPSDSSVRPDTNRQDKIKTCRPKPAPQSETVESWQVHAFASEELREIISFYADVEANGDRPSSLTVIRACRERAMMLGVSGADWSAASDRIGAVRVALCLAVADRNTGRGGRYTVRETVPAFFGLLKAETRERSVLAALVQELRCFAEGNPSGENQRNAEDRHGL